MNVIYYIAIIIVRTVDDKMLWLDVFLAATRYAHNNLTKRGVSLDDVWYQPLWINESNISQCQNCQNKFKMFASKRHCRGW